MTNGDPLPAGWVKLNVGGQVFQTTRQTLCREPDGFLARLVADDERVPSAKDENGAYLIDRDPENFSIILSYLRHGALKISGDSNKEELIEEAEFYNLPALANQLKNAKFGITLYQVIIKHDDKMGCLWIITGKKDSALLRDLRVHELELDGEQGAYRFVYRKSDDASVGWAFADTVATLFRHNYEKVEGSGSQLTFVRRA